MKIIHVWQKLFNKNIKYYIPCIFIVLWFFVLNILQYPMTDEWAQIVDPSITEGPYYIISRYFTYVSRVGDVFLRIFLYLFQDNIFLEQIVFGIINSIIFTLFLWGIYSLINSKKTIDNKRDSFLFTGVFFCVYVSGHFNQSYISQPNVANYFWIVFCALLAIVPYYTFLCYPDKKTISPFLLYFSVMFFGFITGWGSELLGPVILVALAVVFYYYTFIKKQKLPLWFYLGGIMIFIGWCLVFFGPGHRIRNIGSGYYRPIWGISIQEFLLKTSAWFGIYTAVSLPLTIPSLLALVHIKKNNPQQRKTFATICSFLLMGLFTAFMFALTLFHLLPPRAWVIFTLFFILSAGFSLQYYLDFIYTPKKKLMPILCVFIVFIGTLHIVEIINYRKHFTPIFVEIQSQKDEGIKNIRIETEMYTVSKSLYLRWVDYFFVMSWILDRIAIYYEVDRIDFVDKKTGKTYREKHRSGELKVL